MASSASASAEAVADAPGSAEAGADRFRPFLDILADREGKGCAHESHEHVHEVAARGVAAGSGRGPVRVVIDGELTPEMIHRALTEGTGPSHTPMTTKSSVERVEAIDEASPSLAAARLARGFFLLHEQRVAAFRAVEAAGASLMAAASDCTDTGRVMAAVMEYQRGVGEATERLARATDGIKAVGADAAVLEGCAEAEAVVRAVSECQGLERERLQLTAERQGMQLAVATGRPLRRRRPGADDDEEDEEVDARGALEDAEARLLPLSARVQAAMDALREEVADAMLSLPEE